MKTPLIIVLEAQLRGLDVLKLSGDPAVRAVVADESAAINKRLSKLNREQADAAQSEGASREAALAA